MKTKTSASFSQGFTRALDLSGTKKWPKLSNNGRVDYEAIRSDWENVGRAIEEGTRKFKKSGIK